MQQSSGLRFLWSLTGLTLALWFAWPWGSELFKVPALVLVLSLAFRPAWAAAWAGSIGRWISRPKVQRGLTVLMVVQALLWILLILIRYYSFQVSVFDAGLHSNILYNLSQGEPLLSYYGVHFLADHFTPSFGLLSLLYLITPSIHWLMLAKGAAFLVCPLIFYRIICALELPHPKATALVVASYWVLFYNPLVSALEYQFQPSNLAPPFVLLAILFWLQRRWLGFWLCLVFVLGFKEHMGALWIGLGAMFFMKEDRRVLGLGLALGGVLAIYLIMFVAMPYFRLGLPPWSGLERVGPFADLLPKAWYLFWLLVPVGFLPLFDWRRALLFMPAVGVNLVSRLPTMYSSHYHYDDLGATLLLVASLLIWRDRREMILQRWGQLSLRLRRFLPPLLLALFIVQWPQSSLRRIQHDWPSAQQWALTEQIQKFTETYGHPRLAVQDDLGPHIEQRNIQVFRQYPEAPCDQKFKYPIAPDWEPEYLLLSPAVSSYGIADLPTCLRALEASDRFESIEGFEPLLVFKRLEEP
ncbi:MAG: DUF2079 domain-containing protein [bacterium]|nr:DUF2079 domain-containing protein [bacterium]